MNRVNSSQIHSVGHDAATSTLQVKFHVRGCEKKNADCKCGGGPTYHYPEFSADEHAAFIGAESLGKHFGKHIRGRKFTKEEVSVGNQ